MIPLIAGAVISGGMGLARSLSAKKRQEAAEREAQKSRAEMNSQKAAFAGLDTSNPYTNMENTMEDLTVNQQQAQFQAQQNQQNQANVLNNLRGSAGGSGIAALAQQMANSGQLAAQKASATIGQQESANQMAAAKQASTIQLKEREGDTLSRTMERDKVSTLLGMAQNETAGFQDQAAGYEAAKWDGIGQIAGAATSALTGGI